MPTRSHFTFSALSMSNLIILTEFSPLRTEPMWCATRIIASQKKMPLVGLGFPRPSRRFPSNCVRRPYINNRPPSPSRSVSMICCKSTYYITLYKEEERGEERILLCILYSPPQMRVIMATIDERLSFSLLLFPLQKMTFHWVLVQKSNDLSPSLLSPLLANTY